MQGKVYQEIFMLTNYLAKHVLQNRLHHTDLSSTPTVLGVSVPMQYNHSVSMNKNSQFAFTVKNLDFYSLKKQNNNIGKDEDYKESANLSPTALSQLKQRSAQDSLIYISIHLF